MRAWMVGTAIPVLRANWPAAALSIKLAYRLTRGGAGAPFGTATFVSAEEFRLVTGSGSTGR